MDIDLTVIGILMQVHAVTCNPVAEFDSLPVFPFCKDRLLQFFRALMIMASSGSGALLINILLALEIG